MAQYWLFKTEPQSYSIDDLARDGRTSWEGVRNYQARNFLRAARLGDGVILYHSSVQPPGAVGLARVVGEARPDPTAFDPTSKYYDEGSKADDPRWFLVDVAFEERFPHPVTLDELKADPALAGLEVTRRGSRLSITPVSEDHWARILALGRAG